MLGRKRKQPSGSNANNASFWEPFPPMPESDGEPARKRQKNAHGDGDSKQSPGSSFNDLLTRPFELGTAPFDTLTAPRSDLMSDESTLFGLGLSLGESENAFGTGSAAGDTDPSLITAFESGNLSLFNMPPTEESKEDTTTFWSSSFFDGSTAASSSSFDFRDDLSLIDHTLQTAPGTLATETSALEGTPSAAVAVPVAEPVAAASVASDKPLVRTSSRATDSKNEPSDKQIEVPSEEKITVVLNNCAQDPEANEERQVASLKHLKKTFSNAILKFNAVKDSTQKIQKVKKFSGKVVTMKLFQWAFFPPPPTTPNPKSKPKNIYFYSSPYCNGPCKNEPFGTIKDIMLHILRVHAQQISSIFPTTTISVPTEKNITILFNPHREEPQKKKVEGYSRNKKDMHELTFSETGEVTGSYTGHCNEYKEKSITTEVFVWLKKGGAVFYSCVLCSHYDEKPVFNKKVILSHMINHHLDDHNIHCSVIPTSNATDTRPEALAVEIPKQGHITVTFHQSVKNPEIKEERQVMALRHRKKTLSNITLIFKTDVEATSKVGEVKEFSGRNVTTRLFQWEYTPPSEPNSKHNPKKIHFYSSPCCNVACKTDFAPVKELMRHMLRMHLKDITTIVPTDVVSDIFFSDDESTSSDSENDNAKNTPAAVSSRVSSPNNATSLFFNAGRQRGSAPIIQETDSAAAVSSSSSSEATDSTFDLPKMLGL
jgi:hypothetical protein